MRRGLISLVLLLVGCDGSCEVRTGSSSGSGGGSGSALTYPGAVTGPALTAEAPADPAAWKAGDAALVLWQGRWWRGRILAVRGPDRYYIHYDGWEDRWDEEVPVSRLAPIAVEAP